MSESVSISRRARTPAPAKTETHECPICSWSETRYIFTMKSFPMLQCPQCATAFLYPQPTDDDLAKIYNEGYFLGGNQPEAQAKRGDMKRLTARVMFERLKEYRGKHGGTLLEIGCGQGESLVEAETLGYDVTGVEFSSHSVGVAQKRLQRGRVTQGEITSVDLPERTFDVVMSMDVVEHVRNPRAFMQAVHRVLKPDGVLMLVTISLDTWTARLLRHNWMEFKVEHLTYFSNNSLQTLAFLTGFEQTRLEPAYKILSPPYILDHFERYPVPLFTRLLRLGYRLLPTGLRERSLKLSGSGIVLMGRPRALPARRKLSVVVPVYNEIATFEPMITQLLALELSDLEKEVIIVESNSTDGTRDVVLRYRDHPQVKVILEDRPRGKGFAVRTGFQHATGDFIIIQDADLEYDLNDYPALLRPLMNGRRCFVLGSRHSDDSEWHIRKFENEPLKSGILNLGHIFFRTAFNLLYRQRLKDPFTMYKVFLRDCLDGLHFESNRFDFDYELVIKLLRKGYQPVEVPINYRSRSFQEGKKVSMWRDPPTWIAALIKFRFSPLYQKRP
jgi:2-polyprenyl-3-methyl-5-hydroxy-6-metoxy-1,4-benzoquinol methylase